MATRASSLPLEMRAQSASTEAVNLGADSATGNLSDGLPP